MAVFETPSSRKRRICRERRAKAGPEGVRAFRCSVCPRRPVAPTSTRLFDGRGDADRLSRRA